jgi:hypothetical protein
MCRQAEILIKIKIDELKPVDQKEEGMHYGFNRRERRALIFVALTGVLLLLSGCSLFKKEKPKPFVPGQAWVADMRSHINDSISDNDRKSQLLNVVDQFELELIKLDVAVQKYYQKLIAVDTNYESTADDFRKVFNDFNQEKQAFRTRFMDQRDQMVKLTTPEEWDKLADISSKETLFLNWQRPAEI